MAEESDRARPCAKDWIFGVMYAASQEETAPQCSLVIPLTLLFNRGYPEKVIISETQKKYVRGFATPFQQTPPTGSKELKTLRKTCFRYCHEMLVEYGQQNGYTAIQQDVEEPILCTVTYADGEREDLSLGKFERLFRTDVWCKQLVMIQGYVPYHTLQTGSYLRRSRVRSLIDDHATEATHQLTRSLAGFVDHIYEISAEKTLTADKLAVNQLSAGYTNWNSNRGRQNIQAMYENHNKVLNAEMNLNEHDKGSFRVSEMEATFGLDHHGRVVFLYMKKALLETTQSSDGNSSSSISQSKKNSLKASMENEIAVAVTKDLLKLLTQARKKGNHNPIRTLS